MDDAIVNRVEESGLIQLELNGWLHPKKVVECDLAASLVDGLVLMEKPFRETLNAWTAEEFEGCKVAIHCSADAILPEWAWMLAASRIVSLGGHPEIGSPDEVMTSAWVEAVASADVLAFQDARIMVRGCAAVGGPKVLSAVVSKLQPVVRSLMFGEACSSVPVYKKRTS
jgi:hypothetical protein